MLLAGSTARVNLTASYSLADWTNGACSPCNLFNTPPTIAEFNVLLTNAYITYLPDATVNIRRFKYTPMNSTAIANAITQANSWSNDTQPQKKSGAGNGAPPRAQKKTLRAEHAPKSPSERPSYAGDALAGSPRGNLGRP